MRFIQNCVGGQSVEIFYLARILQRFQTHLTPIVFQGSKLRFTSGLILASNPKMEEFICTL